jgi:hypothetical protein
MVACLIQSVYLNPLTVTVLRGTTKMHGNAIRDLLNQETFVSIAVQKNVIQTIQVANSHIMTMQRAVVSVVVLVDTLGTIAIPAVFH